MALTNEGGIFAIINGIIEGLPQTIGNFGGKIAGFAESVASGAGDVFGKVSSVSLGGAHFSSPEPAQMQIRAPEIAAIASSKQFEFDPRDLGDLSAQVFGGQSGVSGRMI